MIDDGSDDLVLVERALAGSRDALQQLVARHQTFVYGVAFKMYGTRADAEDLAQEVLVKAITSLRTFRGQSAFRTWLYRITVNHFLKTRRRGMELVVVDFATYFDAVDATPDGEWDPSEREAAERATEEVRLRCTAGMLMCLDRPQRITYILGALFEVPHVLGGEILGISPGNFRVRLHRARADLYEWMNRRCGLINTDNPCRCHKKAKAYVQQGVVDPEHLVFSADYVVRIEHVTRKGARAAMDTVEDLHERMFRAQPIAVTRVDLVEQVLGNATIRSFFDVC